MKTSKTQPQTKDVILNEYLIMMQVVSHAMMTLLGQTKFVTEMLNGLSKEEAERFFTLSESDKRIWANKLYQKLREKKEDDKDV